MKYHDILTKFLKKFRVKYQQILVNYLIAIATWYGCFYSFCFLSTSMSVRLLIWRDAIAKAA